MVFHDLSWTQYQAILTVLPQPRSARLVYAQGTLEISKPSAEHTQAGEMINIFIRVLVLKMGLKLKSMGSTTLDREDLDRGSESDKAYYIQNQPLVAGRKVNLPQDPPPDLVVEIDITHTDMAENRLYATMGVPEFWRFDGRQLRMYQLQNGQYVETETSPTFTLIAKEDFYTFNRQRQARRNSRRKNVSRVGTKAVNQVSPATVYHICTFIFSIVTDSLPSAALASSWLPELSFQNKHSIMTQRLRACR